MSQVVLTIASSCANGYSFCIFGIALLHRFKVSLFNNCIDCCTFSCYIFIIELCDVAF